MAISTHISKTSTAVDLSAGRSNLLTRIDLRNLGLLALGFVCVLVFVSPVRAFPIADDWIYAHSVGDLLNWDYKMPLESQANLVSHVAWGAIFAALFGNNFTVLTISTLVMSLLCLAIFYILLRHLDIAPSHALLGTALLGFNPLYIFLSYSFMTELTFITYMLAACLFFVRGMRGYGEHWFWLSSVVIVLSYLARQHGLLILVAALACLYWSRMWTWRRALSITLLPVLVIAAYMAWERTQPPAVGAVVMTNNIQSFMYDPVTYIARRGQGIGWIVLSMGLYLAPLARLPRRRLLLIPIFGLLALSLAISVRFWGSAFPVNGNVLDNTGFVMWYYHAAPIWAEWVWLSLGVVSAAILSLYLAALGEDVHDWWRARRERTADPALMLYLLASAMAAVIVIIMPTLNDRYMLPLLPIVMIPALRRMSAVTKEAGSRQYAPNLRRWAPLALLTLFSVIGQRDYMEHLTVRWNEAESLAVQGVPRYQIDGGAEWQGQYLYEDGVRRLREKGEFPPHSFPPFAVLDPTYLISDVPVEGYIQVDSQPYVSWLNGGQERHVLVLRRR
ncbi:MAG TPA: glycosyltransferase family 39 protein [Chloroflexia bacterium]|nr:glycosyltransferase family 39 protein [Chloroflexia bacterium]